jgi:hypothetical protein
MPRYLVERTFTVSIDEMPPVGRESKRLVKEVFTGVTWEHSHVVLTADGTVRTYCVYDAPDEAAIHEHALALGRHHVDLVYEIAGDVTPDDNPDV